MRILILLYGLLAYIIGMGGLTFFILWVGGWDYNNLMPVDIDGGTPGPLLAALLINIGLIILWGLQHTVMARPAFKRWWTSIIPKAAERSTYVLLSGLLMIAIPLAWQPVEGTLWHVDNDVLRIAILTLQIIGWLMAVTATFIINHFELFGLQQVYHNFTHRTAPPPHFAERFLYRIVRHPLQLGFIIGLWAAPTMSMTHFLLSMLMTLYILIALYFEERDLITLLGDDYIRYQQRVRKLIPLPKFGRNAPMD